MTYTTGHLGAMCDLVGVSIQEEVFFGRWMLQAMYISNEDFTGFWIMVR